MKLFCSSRDTTIKVWSIDTSSSSLASKHRLRHVHSLGGHSGSITNVKFWSVVSYRAALKRLSEIKDDEDFAGNALDIDGLCYVLPVIVYAHKMILKSKSVTVSF